MTIDTQRLRELARAATPGHWTQWEGHGWVMAGAPEANEKGYMAGTHGQVCRTDCGDFSDAQGIKNAEYIAAANPATVLALLDEVEKQKSRADILEETVNRLQQYVILNPTLDKDRVKQLLTVGSPWVFCLRNYLSDANMELDKLTDEVSKLRAIEAAARNLAKVKGRHHAEIAYQKLVEVLK